MVIGIFGESCTGKSTLAEGLRRELDARVYTGRDYLRLARDQASARRAFQALLEGARCGEHVIWVISEQEDLALLPEGSLRVLVTAGLPEIKVRFARRMGGALPPPVEAMLERKHGCFDGEAHDLHVSSGQTDLGLVCGRIRAMVSAG